jgi:U3 small nucleolar RNA-associated protein 18
MSEGRKTNPEQPKLAKDQYDESESDPESEDIMEEDEDEEELNRLVLGDGAGFASNLAGDYVESEEGSDVEEGADGEDQGLEGVDDADVSTGYNLSHRIALRHSAAVLCRCWTICCR